MSKQIHWETARSSQERPPRRSPDDRSDEVLLQISARLHPIALGIALGALAGIILVLATNVLVFKGGPNTGSHLGLLSHYLPGYDVSVLGSLLGGLYAGVGGFLLGWCAACLRNLLLDVYLWLVRLWANLSQTHFLDRVD